MKSNAMGFVHNHTATSNASRLNSARSRSIGRALLVLVFFSMLLPAPDAIVSNRVMAAPGDPVPGFGTDGVVETDFFGGHDAANAITPDQRSRIVAAGSASTADRGTDFAVARYNPNGTLDSTFGQGGKATTDFFGGNDGARGVAVQLDGKIILSGFATNGTERLFTLARFNETGNLDQAFGAGGKVVLDLGSTSEAFKVVLQSDGKILAAGDSRLQNSLDFTVVRLNQADGSLDRTFGVDGVARIDFGFTDRAIDLSVDADNIFVCGIVVKTATDSDFGVTRLSISNGTLNNAFDADGKVTIDFSGKQDGAQKLTLREAIPLVDQDHLLITGFATAETRDFAFAALSYQGNFISNFLEGSKKTIDISGSTDMAFGLIDQPDGDFVAAGWAGSGSLFDLGIIKMDRSGNPDLGWGLHGEYTLDTASGANNVAFDAVLYDDTIVTAGTGLNPATGNDDFIITQHENEKFFEFTKEASPNPAVEGDIVTYTFTMKNLTDVDRKVYITDTLPDGVSALLAGDFKTAVSGGKYVISNPINVPSGETRKTFLRVQTSLSGLIKNDAVLNAEYGYPIHLGKAEVSSEVKKSEITGAQIVKKDLFLSGVFPSPSDTDLFAVIDPQAQCPVILIDGQEQKTKRDPDNASTVLIAKKGGKKIARGQTVTLKVRLCNGTETAGFTFPRPQ
jgi:uncharacterized delta-60 repeat protein/uncharacterized repeat protein (TIGR01451 family)